MKAGSIGIIESGKGELNDFVKKVKIDGERFDSLTQCIQITEDVRLPDGRTAQFGRAAIEDITEDEKSEISDDGDVRTYKQRDKIVKTTELLFVPGSFIAVGSSSGEFAFPLIDGNTDNEVSSVEFDIEDIIEEYPNANQWKVGFSEYVGNTKNGVVHGEQLLTESSISEMLLSAPKNQIGLEYDYGGKLIKNFVTNSGYAEVYQPSDISTGEFAKYVEDELLPYSYIP